MRLVGFLSPILVVAASIACSGCWLMPTSGPASFDVRSGSADVNSLPYAFLKLNPQIIAILAKNAPRLAGGMTPRRPPQEIRFGVGDIVGVTIFEAASGGLFIAAEAGVRPGNYITLPNQDVDHEGNISVPYGGAIRAKRRTPTEVQRAIVETIKNRAIDPQVVVSLVDQRTSLISVLGDVNTPSRFPANAAGEHILDAIARAGQRETVPFGALVYEPSNNVFVHPKRHNLLISRTTDICGVRCSRYWASRANQLRGMENIFG